MKMISCLVIFAISIVIVPNAEGLKQPRMLNSSLLQSRVDDNVPIFESTFDGVDRVLPNSVLLDFRDNKVAGATLTFSLKDNESRDISIESCRQAVEGDYGKQHNLKRYGVQNTTGGLWSNTDRSFIVHLVKPEDEDELQIIFLSKNLEKRSN